jgi:Ser/Thr protein kinase RdoA (MazF antagonist)
LVARAPRVRIKELLASTRRSLELNERALAGEIRKESRARRWLTAARPLLANADSNLEHVDYLKDETLVMAHLDLWGSHMVSGESGVSLLDCATVGAAPAVFDLAQLIARNGEWSDERVEQMLNGYTAEIPLPPSQRRMLPWLTALDAISSCGHLLARAHDERRPLSDSERRLAFAGADQQLELLQTMVTAFIPPPPRQYRRQGRKTSRPTR